MTPAQERLLWAARNGLGWIDSSDTLHAAAQMGEISAYHKAVRELKAAIAAVEAEAAQPDLLRLADELAEAIMRRSAETGNNKRPGSSWHGIVNTARAYQKARGIK